MFMSSTISMVSLTRLLTHYYIVSSFIIHPYTIKSIRS